MRKCRMCGVEQDEAEFSWDWYRCRGCMRAKARAYNRLHRAEKADYQRRWNLEHPTYSRDYLRRWRKGHSARSRDIAQRSAKRSRVKPGYRKRFAARQMVRWAVWGGILKKPDGCGRCPAAGRLQAHHEDYDKPLDVEWLCGDCHGLTRRKNFRIGGLVRA